MRFKHWFILVPILSAAIGCDSGAPPNSMSREEAPVGGAVPPPAPAQKPEKLDERKIIYTSKLQLRVVDLDAAALQVQKLVEEQKGYIASSDISGVPDYYNNRSANWVVRVPVANYQAFLNEAKSLGTVAQETSTAEDVTEQYLDVTAQIKNKRVEEDRLVELLKNATAKLEDILTVEKELSRVRGEIEQAEGKKRYIENRTDFTTVTLNLSQVTERNLDVDPSFGGRISRTFYNSVDLLWQAIQSLAIALVGLAPWLPLIAIGCYIVWRLWKRNNARRLRFAAEEMSRRRERRSAATESEKA